MSDTTTKSHAHQHAFGWLQPTGRDLLTQRSRRWFLQTGLAGVGGLTLPRLLQARESGKVAAPHSKKSVILFWLSGGPSHIDMWDPKPDAPSEIRGPYHTIPTKVSGIRLCEHLPLQASIMDKLSILRAVDCKASNHTPITFQAGNPLAQRTDNGRDGAGYPSMGSVVAKFRGPNHPDLPAFVGLAPSWVADIYEAGDMGSQYAPVKGLEVVGKFGLPEGIVADRLRSRNELRSSFDRLRRDLDQQKTLEQLDRYNRQAYEMVLGGHVQRAFDVSQESDSARDAYGRNEIGEKALLARRLVEAGVSFTVVSGAWGYFDHHGDNVRWGGIEKGLTPLLPNVDRAMYALVNDLEQRGLLDDTLVLMLGEFGRSPVINKEAGREHWTNVMSMLVAGGGLRHGQAVGSTDHKGYEIKDGLVRPQDLAATVYRHMGIDLQTHWISPQGRPTPIVVEGGRPIPELA
ncbi:DUF1501 domain-containing protein [bacterium]|nr:DUF1501 domain-containing protein [bacterium]